MAEERDRKLTLGNINTVDASPQSFLCADICSHTLRNIYQPKKVSLEGELLTTGLPEKWKEKVGEKEGNSEKLLL